MNRVVRRCFLLGDDPITGKNYDHRKQWIEALLKRFAASFGIDLLGFAILSNHFHLILRSRPDVVAAWDDDEIARRWLMLCPVRKTAEGLPETPSEPELNSIRNDAQKLATIRTRLSDLGWWMRLLCQHVATRANREDQEPGKFWQSRYRAVRILDETALLACAAYVDLNPIRAALAQTLETSDHTSAQRRIESLVENSDNQPATPEPVTPIASTVISSHLFASPEVVASTPAATNPTVDQSNPPATAKIGGSSPDGFLSPVSLEERTGDPGAVPSQTGQRCSDKGFLPITVDDYLLLLDWTARLPTKGKRGKTPDALQPLFERLSLNPQTWCQLVSSFGKLYSNVAGSPATIEATASRVTQRRFHLRSAARTLFDEAPRPTSA
jgi:hypothetical protein